MKRACASLVVGIAAATAILSTNPAQTATAAPAAGTARPAAAAPAPAPAKKVVGMSAPADLAAAGQLVPTIAATFPLREASVASAMGDLAATGDTFPLEQGGAAMSGQHGPGKVVLQVA
jgi:hypothetical protein